MLSIELDFRNPTHILLIPGWTPISLNQLLYRHWTKTSKQKSSDKEWFELCAKTQRVPEAKGKRKVDLYIVLPKGGRPKDADNIWKSLLDALVHIKMLKDDSRHWVQRGEVIWAAMKDMDAGATFILLKDIDADNCPGESHEQYANKGADSFLSRNDFVPKEKPKMAD